MRSFSSFHSSWEEGASFKLKFIESDIDWNLVNRNKHNEAPSATSAIAAKPCDKPRGKIYCSIKCHSCLYIETVTKHCTICTICNRREGRFSTTWQNFCKISSFLGRRFSAVQVEEPCMRNNDITRQHLHHLLSSRRQRGQISSSLWGDDIYSFQW